MKDVLAAFRRGIGDHIRVHDNMLIWASNPHLAMTWMDAVVDGKPVTGRDGYQVEINALWYNAICYTLALARKHRDNAFVHEWKEAPDRIKEAFNELFWYPQEEYLADYVDERRAEHLHPPEPDHRLLASLRHAERRPETERNLGRTAPPADPQGAQDALAAQPALRMTVRRRPAHPRPGLPPGNRDGRGCSEHYVRLASTSRGKSSATEAVEIVKNFEEDISDNGLASISEIYDGDPPYNARGTISQAWSVGAILRINEMIEEYGGCKSSYWDNL